MDNYYNEFHQFHSKPAKKDKIHELGKFFKILKNFVKLRMANWIFFSSACYLIHVKKVVQKISERILINKVAKNILRLLPFTTVLGSFLIVLSQSVEIIKIYSHTFQKFRESNVLFLRSYGKVNIRLI